MPGSVDLTNRSTCPCPADPHQVLPFLDDHMGGASQKERKSLPKEDVPKVGATAGSVSALRPGPWVAHVCCSVSWVLPHRAWEGLRQLPAEAGPPSRADGVAALCL